MPVTRSRREDTAPGVAPVGLPVRPDRSDTLPLSAISSASLSSLAYRHIREQLINGHLAPGTRIAFRDAADALGISVTPVREALLQLAAEQALIPGRGRTFEVPSLEAGRCRELWDIRLALEPQCADAALKAVTPALLQRMESLNERMLAAKQDRDVDGGIRFNREFHAEFYAVAGLPLLTWMIETAWVQSGAYLRHFHNHHVQTRNGISVQGPHIHTTILNAVRHGDATLLRRSIKRDLIETRDGILQLLQ